MKLVSVKPSDRPDKKYVAEFCLCREGTNCSKQKRKYVHFGQRGSSTFLDHADTDKRKNYIKRHRPNENHRDPFTAGALSRWLLWGPTSSLTKNIRLFRERFGM